MLQKLTVKNFQCHEKTIIEFDPLCITLVGNSDAGKTAVLRALRWLMTNNPAGLSFLRHGTEEATAILEVDNRKIVRKRSKDNNVYKLDGEVYKAFGHDVPSDIAKLLNIGDVNFQQQMDSSFWFSLSAGQVSKELNQIIDLGVIDETMAFVAAEQRRAKAAVEVSEQRLLQSRTERDRLSFVQDMDTELKALETLQIEIDEKAKNRCQIERLVDEAVRHTQRRGTLSEALKCSTTLISIGDRLRHVREQRESLDELLIEIVNIQRIVERPHLDTEEMDSLRAELETVAENLIELTAILDSIRQLGETQCRLSKELTSVRSEMEELVGEQCPLCGSKVDPHCVF